MRLWHIDLVSLLPRQQLLGQHRECCALRGLGWGRKHATVDYVFEHPMTWLVKYHLRVIKEMKRRGYKVDPVWLNHEYRGKRLGGCPIDGDSQDARDYPEHNAAYLAACLANLRSKGIEIRSAINER